MNNLKRLYRKLKENKWFLWMLVAIVAMNLPFGVDKELPHYVILNIEGDRIPARKFRYSIDLFYDFINEVADNVAGIKKAVDWSVSLKGGSVKLLNKPESKKIDQARLMFILNVIDNGIEIIKTQKKRPPFFTDRSLEIIQDLAIIPRKEPEGINNIQLIIQNKKYDLDHKISENIETIMEYKYKALGSIEGKLETISERRGLKFIVYDSLTDRPIRCIFDDELLSEITNAFGKRVYVYGIVYYVKSGIPQTIRVKELKIFPEEHELPSPSEIYGILKE